MSERITRRAEWDGTFSLLVDGQVVSARQPLAVIQDQQTYLETGMKLNPEKYFIVKPLDKP